MSARHIDTVRGGMAWLEAGAGWPVLLLHAFPLSAEMWRPQLERVPEGWRFIAPQLFRPERSSVADYAADLGEFMDALELDDAVIAGLSMGGYIAFAMYRQAPARFSGLVLADTRPQADTAAGRAARDRMRDVLAREGLPAIADQMLPKLLSESVDPAVAAAVRRLIERADPAAIDAALVALRERPDSTGDLPYLSCATLVLVGEHDAITPVADARAMQQAIPRSTLTVIPGAAHLSNLEQPDAFSRTLADFLLARL